MDVQQIKIADFAVVLDAADCECMHKDMRRLSPVASEQREHATQQEPHRFFSLMTMMML